jgi:hypothetical protein
MAAGHFPVEASPGDLGVMTMAESSAALVRACGLAASLDAAGETMLRALLHAPDLVVPSGFFDIAIPTPADPYRGRWFYLNKLVHPFALTPFRRTLFLDSDVIVRRPVSCLVQDHFRGRPVALCVKHEPIDSTDVLGNHFVPQRFAQAFGTPLVQNPDGGGHMYFESGLASASIVRRALEFATCQEDLYHWLSGGFGFVADELALLAILTIDGIGLPTRIGAVHAVQVEEVDRIVAFLERPAAAAPDMRYVEGVTLFHFFGRAHEAEAYTTLTSSVPARWPA